MSSMWENIFQGLVSNFLFWLIVTVIPGVLIYFLITRQKVKRDFSQVLGTYLLFHKRVARESNVITVNLLVIKNKFPRNHISVKYLNGAEFKDGKIKAMYVYKGTIIKGDPEYVLHLHCDKMNEYLYGMVDAQNSSFKLCPLIHLSRSFKKLPYAAIGIIIGQQYFIENIQNTNMKALIEAALDFVSNTSNSPYFIEITKTQHESLTFFHDKFGIDFVEKIESDLGLIRKDSYDQKKIKNFGPYI